MSLSIFSKKNRLMSFLLIALLSLSLVITACGGGNNQEGGDTAKEPTENQGGDSQQPKEEKNPFDGETVTFIVPFGPGGGYDTYARLIAPYLEKYTGATVVVQNVSGGGGMVGTNKVYNAKADDNVMGIIGGANLVFAQAAGLEGVQYQVDKFNFLARVSADPSVLIVGPKKPYESIEDLKNASGLKIAATGVGEDDFYTWSVIFNAFGVENYSWVTGWEGSSQWLSAVAAGEVDGGPVSAGSAQSPVKNGDAKPVMQVSSERDERFPDVPTALESMDKGNENYKLVEAITNVLIADRLLATHPGMSAEKVKALREGLDKAMHDSEFLDKAKQAKRPVVYLSGDKLEAAMKSAMGSVDLLKPIFDEAAAKAQ